jgi:iron(III) transport system ATP-binding protein
VLPGGAHERGTTLPGRLVKHAYLGSVVELTLATDLGEIFVVSPDVQRRWQAGETLALGLSERGVSVVTHSRG